MGSDPRRLHGLRPDERHVALALERVTGATARAHDVGPRQGAVDLLLVHDDGRTAAVEVTTHAGDGVRRRDALRRGGRRAWPDPARPWWTVTGHGPGGAASLETLPDAVAGLLAVPSVARRAAKVAAATGVDERHLVVEVGEGGLPNRLLVALGSPGLRPPTGDLQAPEGLTHLWLTAGWAGSPMVGWRRGGGWSVHSTRALPGRRGRPGRDE